MERFWKKHKERLYLSLEIILMLSVFLSPFVFGPQFRFKSKFFSNTLFRVEFLVGASKEAERHIASSTLEAPEPTDLNTQENLKWDIEDRQIRFEFQNEAWSLIEIEKKNFENEWETVQIMHDKASAKTYSIFVELDDGDNSFQLKYRAKNGHTLIYPLKISRTKKHKT